MRLNQTRGFIVMVSQLAEGADGMMKMRTGEAVMIADAGAVAEWVRANANAQPFTIHPTRPTTISAVWATRKHRKFIDGKLTTIIVTPVKVWIGDDESPTEPN